MYARVTRTTSTTDTLEREIAWFEQSVLPRARSQPGFVGALDMYDRSTGAGLTVTLWETEEAREASESLAAGMRSEAESSFAAEVVGVERYEVTAKAL